MDKTRRKVLLADDEHWVCENLRGLLQWQEYGYELLPSAQDGEDALQKVRQWKPDILITDINMPFLSGLDLLRKVREESRHTAVIILSGYDEFHLVRDALLSGAIDYLRKPANRSDLIKVLQEADQHLDYLKAEAQQQRQDEKRRQIALSMQEDHDMSSVLHTGKRETLREEVISRLFDLDRQMMQFSLVMFRTAEPSALLKETGGDTVEIVVSVKEMLLAQVPEGRGLVFHDVYRTGFYFMLTDAEGDHLESICKRVLVDLRQMANCPAGAMISRRYFSLLSSIADAYRDCLLAHVMQPFTGQNQLFHVEQAEGTAVQERLTNELEKQLLSAIETGNRRQFAHGAFEMTGLDSCEQAHWVFREVQQTVSAIAFLLQSHLPDNAPASLRLQVDQTADAALQAVNLFDGAEMRAQLSRMIDLFFSAAPAAQSSTIHDTVNQVCAYIDQHYFENITLTDLARRFSVDSAYLSRVFKQDTGVTLMMYLTQRRMARAKQLLQDDTLSITEIAQLTGYSDYGYFSRVFRKMEGVSPSAYREGEGGQA